MSQKDKQNLYSTADSLNYKMNRGGQGLIPRAGSDADQRYKILTHHNEELQKTREIESKQHKEEMALMFKRTLGLESRVSQLESIKIENQEEITELQRKVQNMASKLQAAEKSNKFLLEEVEKLKEQLSGRPSSLSLKETTQEVLLLKQKLESYQTINGRNQKIIEDKKIQNKELEKKLKAMQLENKELQSLLEKTKLKVKSSQQDLNARISQLMLKVEDLNREKQEGLQQISRKELRLMDFEKKYELLENTLRQYKQVHKNKADQISLQVQSLRTQNQFKQKIISELKENLVKWQSQCKKVTDSRDEIEDHFMKAKMQLAKNLQLQKEIQRVKQNYEQTLRIKQDHEQQLLLCKKQLQLTKLKHIREVQEQANERMQKIQKLQQKMKNEHSQFEFVIRNLEAQCQQLKEKFNFSSKKCQQLQQLANTLKDKIKQQNQIHAGEIKDLLRQIEVYQGKYDQLHEQFSKISCKNQELAVNYTKQMEKMKTENRGLQQSFSLKQKQMQLKLKTCSEEIQFLQEQLKKWKQYRNDSNFEFEQLKKQNRKLRLVLQQKQQSMAKIKQRLENEACLTQRYQNSLRQIETKHKKTIIQFQEQIKDCQIRIKLANKEQQNQFEQRCQIMQSQNQKKIAELKNRNQIQIQNLEAQLRKYERRQEELILLMKDLENQNNILNEKLLQLNSISSKEMQSYQIQIQQLQGNAKLGSEKLIDAELKLEVRDKTLKDLHMQLQSKEQQNKKYIRELERISLNLEQIKHQNISEAQSRSQLQHRAELAEVQKAHLLTQVEEIKMEVLKCSRQKQEMQLLLTQCYQMRQNWQRQRKKRKEIYEKICNIQNQAFLIEPRENQIQLLNLISIRLSKWHEFTQNLISKNQEQGLQNRNYTNMVNKKFKQNLQGAKENYEAVYSKYLKYKNAYLHCKDKLQRHRIEVINDQRFTQEILTHCKTLIPRIQ